MKACNIYIMFEGQEIFFANSLIKVGEMGAMIYVPCNAKNLSYLVEYVSCLEQKVVNDNLYFIFDVEAKQISYLQILEEV